jgi:hypothetical protein
MITSLKGVSATAVMIEPGASRRKEFGSIKAKNKGIGCTITEYSESIAP